MSPGDPAEVVQRCAERLLIARRLATYRWALPFVAGRRVLEVTARPAVGAELLAREAAAVVQVSSSLALAPPSGSTGASSVVADGQRLPFKDGAFDVAVALHVAERVWTVSAFLKELRRVVRPGGVVLLSTVQRRGRLLPGQVPWNEEHLREFDERTWSSGLAAVFGGGCHLFALHADEQAARIERWRVDQDPWEHFLGGPWATPLRSLGSRWRAMRRARDAAAQVEVAARVSREDDGALARRFVVDPGGQRQALDLLAVCGVGEAVAEVERFDPAAYWRDRLTRRPDLTGTGTAGYAVEWQRWLYRGKLRAIRRLFSRQGLRVEGAAVLDLGCGTGFFEDVWERWGARRADGIDLVPEMVERLQRAHPSRHYVCADLARTPEAVDVLPLADLVTAIDVLYHVVDDRTALETLRALLRRLRPGGWFLFSDACVEQQTAPHVRLRSIHHWRQLLGRLGLEIVDKEPTFAVNNRPLRGLQRWPALAGAVQHAVDLPLLRTMPWLANSWTVLARRTST